MARRADEDFDMNLTNIKRGLFRVWASCSALFVASNLLFNFADIAREFSSAADDPKPIFPVHPWWTIACLANFSLTIPLVILIIGGGIIWVYEGFGGSPRRGDC